MLKTGAAYKMSKITKRTLARSDVINPHLRGEQKRIMIQAELSAALQPKREKKSRPDQTPDLDD